MVGLVLLVSLWVLLPSFRAYLSDADASAVKNRIVLGLDLQGGMFLDLEVDSESAVERTLDRLAVELEDLLLTDLVDYVSLDRVPLGVEVILSRGEEVDLEEEDLERLLSGYEVQQTGSRILVQMREEDARQIEGDASEQALEVLRNRIDSLGVAEPSLRKQGEKGLIVQLPGLKDRESALSAIGAQAVLEFHLVEDQLDAERADSSLHLVRDLVIEDREGNVTSRDSLVLQRRPVLSGETVRDAQVQISTLDNQPYVGISFDAEGRRRFARITETHVGRRLAIVLDNRVQSAPVIREAISGGEAQISGNFTLKEASNLAIVLRSGSLPAPLFIREERSVGASLGEDSVRQGLSALGFGMLLVVGFMTFYYRLAGVFASLALVFNLVLLGAALALLQATLTLPGIAGIVLTMGMSVDANVLIFERIREELSKARSIHAAVRKGFASAFWPIFDANITTLVAALALLTFGAGPIKGFAVTLSAGILASMFTAIFFTRFLFEAIQLRSNKLQKISI